MKAKLALMLLMIFYLASIALAANNVIITQVLYDPVNESGGEAVELYNPTMQAIDMGGWMLSTESSSADATIPAGTIISSKSYFLIADSGWKFIHPELMADYEEPITLANTDAGIALTNNATVIDAVGWGSSINIGEALFEGNPSSAVDEGFSLLRKYSNGTYADTNDNSNDFIASTQSFHTNQVSNSEIQVIAAIFDSSPYFGAVNITVDDDSLSDGFQIMPVPKSSRVIAIRVVSGNADNVTLSFDSNDYIMSAIGLLNSTAGIYEANISIPFYMDSGNHSFGITALGSNNLSADLYSVLEIMSLLSVEIDSTSLYFSASSGGFSEIQGDLNLSSANRITIRNTGNKPADFELSGTDLSYGSRILGIGNISFTFDSDYNSGLSGSLGVSKQRKAVSLAPGLNSLQSLSFRLNVPSRTPSGNYSGKIFISATS